MHAPDGLWTDCPDRLTTLGPRSFLCCDLQEKEQQAPRAHHRSTASDTDKLVQAHVECLMSEMKIALDRFERNLFATVQECYDDVRAVGFEKGDDEVAVWGEKNELLVQIGGWRCRGIWVCWRSVGCCLMSHTGVRRAQKCIIN